MQAPDPPVRAAAVVLPCTDLEPCIEFFTTRLAFRLDAIHPADAPRAATLSGHGLTLELERGADGPPGTLRLVCGDAMPEPAELIAPNGTRVELRAATAPEPAPVHADAVPPALVVSRLDGGAAWGAGRAGMLYRDLIPDRLGGRFIASHIRIPDAGPVPDYVHFHEIRFQMIFCVHGWVRLVYEDQGPPFVMRAGDCVLQPPGIRHRVLEASAGLEVVEIGAPAEHLTGVDHALRLPTAVRRRERRFGGQRFVFHEAAHAAWRPWRVSGFEARDVGIAAATDGLAGVSVARRSGTVDLSPWTHDGEFLFQFVLAGTLELAAAGGRPQPLTAGDACVIPARTAFGYRAVSGDAALLEVRLPAVKA